MIQTCFGLSGKNEVRVLVNGFLLITSSALLWEARAHDGLSVTRVSYPSGGESTLSSSHLCVLVAQSCPTLCDPMDCCLPGSSVHGILPARILEWVAIPFSRGSSQPRDRT